MRNTTFALLGAIAIPTAAMAQNPPSPPPGADEIGEVVVTGYRQSLQDALEVKRNSELVVDAVSGGDIGALPDVTIAETLIRLPGVNGTRDRGNQSQAALRGLGPRLVLGLVNGREVASSEPNRNVRWEIYPSEVVSGADVYKSQSADMVAGGVAGTIDIKTIRPLSYNGPSLLVRAGPVYYEGGADIPDYDPYGYRGSASYTHSLGENFAFNFGVTSQRQKNAFPSFQGWGYNDNTITPGNATADFTGDGVPDPLPWGAQTEVKKLTEDRVGVSAALGWRAGENLEFNVDALYSKFTIDEDQNQAWYGRDFWGNWDGSRATCFNQDTPITQIDGTVVAATLTDCFAPVTNVIAKYTEDKDLLVTGITGKYETENWTVSGDLSHSNAERTNRWAAFRSEVWPDTMTFDMRSGRRPSVTTSSNPADPAVQQSYDWLQGQSDGPSELQDELSALRMDVTRRLDGFFRSVQFGARASEREKDYFEREQFYLGVPGPLPASLFSSYSVDEFDAPPLLNGDFDEIVDYVYGGMPVDPDAIVQSSIWKVEENVTEAYALVRFGKEDGALPFMGNFGVRLVRTETTSNGFGQVNGGPLQPLTFDSDYTEALPSLNLTFNVAEDKLFRVGVARVIARPPLDELRASRALWNDAPPATGQAGNPMLEPFIANQLDLSYEWYFGDEALVALAAFYKDVDTHIGYTTQPETIDAITYAVTAPYNGDGGGITGAEFTFQTPFSMIDALRNFGVYFNYAWVDTDVKEFYPSNNPLPVEGYAENTATLDLWYGTRKFEARLGWKYHSPFSIIAGWNGGDVRSLGAERILDFSTSYQINDAFGVRLQVNNLTDEPLRITRDNNSHRLGSFDVYGRRALLDVTFRF